EYHVMLLDRLDVATLVDTLGLYAAFAERALLAGFGEPAQRGCRIGSQDADHGTKVPVDKGEAIAQQVLVVGENLLSASNIAGRSGNFNAIGPHGNGDFQTVFQQAQVF